MIVQRYKYYSIWKLTQASAVSCGLGYNGTVKTESGGAIHKFDKIEGCVIRKVEWDVSPKIRIQYWNRTVHLWLKYFVFMRMININHKAFKNNKTAATLVTFMVSAFWHGFYPVYYLFFFQFFLLERISEILEEFGLFEYFENKNLVTKALLQ
jgi:lysophospholipid acyltransferase